MLVSFQYFLQLELILAHLMNLATPLWLFYSKLIIVGSILMDG
jgi:hypothetical protein